MCVDEKGLCGPSGDATFSIMMIIKVEYSVEEAEL